MKKIFLSIFLIATLAAVSVSDDDSVTQATELLNSKAPRLELITLGGNAIPAGNYNGKQRMVAFFAVNVDQGRLLLKNLKKLQSLAGMEKISILAIDITNKTGNISTYMKKVNLPFQVFTGDSKQFMRAWKIQFLPSVFLVDENDMIRAVLTRDKLRDAESMYSTIKPLIQ